MPEKVSNKIKSNKDIRDRVVSSINWRMCPAPQRFSIATLSTSSIHRLRTDINTLNPVLTYRDVTDVPAAFVADPFLCRYRDYWYLFFEVLNKQGWKGEIGVASSATGRNWQYDRIVLAEEFHLSYPYVFEWEGSCYMIPESAQANRVSLYVAERFPHLWKRTADLVHGEYVVDASILRYKDLWWLFVGAQSSIGLPELRLFLASELAGPYAEHPASPIVSGNYDISRPAGRVLILDGRPVRFAQGLRPDYGSNVHAIEITHLCDSHYKETYLGPGPLLTAGKKKWNNGGMHHIDAHQLYDGNWIACLDGWYYVPKSFRNVLTTLRYPRSDDQ